MSEVAGVIEVPIYGPLLIGYDPGTKMQDNRCSTFKMSKNVKICSRVVIPVISLQGPSPLVTSSSYSYAILQI